MKIVFFGTSEFAIPSLVKLISRHEVVAVVTQPDRKAGRSLRLSPPPTKVLALTKNIPVYQPQDASSKETAAYLKKFDADLFVVISFGQILKSEILSIPKKFAINVHGSLLPKYRGAAPTNWAIINGERSTGVTVIRMNEKMDEGDIILKRPAAIDPDDTNITLSETLSELGASALLEAVGLIGAATAVKFEKQDGSQATYAPKLKKEDGLIDWNEPAERLHNKVRGFLPWPGAYTRFEGRTLKILRTEMIGSSIKESAKPGEVVEIGKEKGIVVRTGSGNIVIKNLQLEGKKALDFDSFIRGHKIPVGYIFAQKISFY